MNFNQISEPNKALENIFTVILDPRLLMHAFALLSNVSSALCV